ncbi:response regulator [cf. Phormidesmis sp. LEGE 11477]|uniref:response regulator n=1 Tax=cf. Phormidesmis sp. LEGE 11477 TaxID=1828680 RepID=UPI00351D6A0C
MSKLRHTILIAEDDIRTRTALVNSLTASGYQVIAAVDGQEALQYFHTDSNTIDLVVLDVLMPKLDGFQVCQRLRTISDVPIIMATVLGSSSDRVTGLEMGANDYIVKPFSTKELIARIRSILRRVTKRQDPVLSEVQRSAIKIGQLVIDPATRRAYIDGHYLGLTEIEFRLIELLASRPGHIFSRGDILEALWGYDASSAADTKTVDVHISRLRIKLNETTHNPKYIVTIRGRGYMFLVQR